MSTFHDAMSSISPWSLLTEVECQLLVPKLVATFAMPGSTIAETCLPAREAFDRAVLDDNERDSPHPTAIEERLLTLRNFLVQTGAYTGGALWQQVTCLKGIRRSYLELLVFHRDEFLLKLTEAGFVINREPFWTIHKFDSARALTRRSCEPSLHFANDRMDEAGYGPTYFFTHWDVSSVWFEESRWRFGRMPGLRGLERLLAALRHQDGFASPETVQSYLAELGLARTED